MGNPTEKSDRYYEYIIVGAGPAGVQLGHVLEQSKRDYMIIEKGDKPGYFFEKYPRHRTLISINKRFNYFPGDDFNLRHDWNSLVTDDQDMRFTKYSDKLFPPADTLVTYMKDFCDKFNIKITYNTAVEKISRNHDDEFILRTSRATMRSKVLIMATGAMEERLPNIPGIELATPYSEHSLDQDKYTNHKVAIIGGGNSAFETADHLAGHAGMIYIHADQGYKLAWDTHFPGDLRAINNSIIDMFHLKSIHGLRKATPTKIEKAFIRGKWQLEMSMDMDLPHWEEPCTAHMKAHFDDIIFCTGWSYIIPEMWDETCKPEITPCGKYPAQMANWESTNIPSLYFAGTVTQGRDRRAASSFIHGFRYSAKVLGHYLNNLRHAEPLPQQNFDEIDIQQLAEFIVKRMSTTSSLYQLNHGVLCDILVLSPEEDVKGKDVKEVDKIKGTARYLYDMPTDWAIERDRFKKHEYAWVLILDDNKASFPKTMDAVDFAVAPRMKGFDLPCQGFVQPMIRRYCFGNLISETALGGNIMVRMDRHYFPGDNEPARGHNKLKKLIADHLGMTHDNLDVEMFATDSDTTLTVWSKDQIQKHRIQESKKSAPTPCNLHVVDPPEWQRSGPKYVLQVKSEQ